MFRNRRRNWFIKRIALGFAVAAVAAPVAQGEGGRGVEMARAKAQNSIAQVQNSIAQAHTYQPVHANVTAALRGPRPHDPALRPPSPHDPMLLVSTQPQSPAPAVSVASRFGRPNATTGTDLEAVNWSDAGFGASIALLLVLLGGGAALAMRHEGYAQTA